MRIRSGHNCYLLLRGWLHFWLQILPNALFVILQRRGLINKFKIPHWNLIRYLRSVENHYSQITPYHNKIHAADVVQSVHVLLQAPALDVSSLSELPDIFLEMGEGSRGSLGKQ